MPIEFPTDYASICARMHAVDPVAYARTRNYVDGAVSHLSPYISRGVLSTHQVYQSLRARGFDLSSAEKFISELAWRDYWQQVWIQRGDAIDCDVLHAQPRGQRHGVPAALLRGNTGIEAIDRAVRELVETGYMHNHVRMYVAAMACNVARCYWLEPARWMHYFLLDADWASNALSWQWVAGANSSKCYWANQDNINTFCHSDQRDTFLDVPYEAFEELSIPDELADCEPLSLPLNLPEVASLDVDTQRPTLVYTLYNLDPLWHDHEDFNRVFLIDTDLLRRYPMGPNTLDFALQLADNIAEIQPFVGSFAQLADQCRGSALHVRAHPTQTHYEGHIELRPAMTDTAGYFRSFFKFWRQCRRRLAEAEA